MQAAIAKTLRSNLGTLFSRAWGTSPSAGLYSKEFLIGAIVFAAVTMNFFLAMMNANALDISRNIVIGGEVLIVLLSVAVCIKAFNKLMTPWVAVIWVLGILFVTLSLFRESIEPKFFRDVLIFPVFVMLGLAYAKGNIIRLFMVLQALIAGVMLFEGLFVDLFGDLVNPLSYYLNTRDWVDENSFWKSDSVLFISAWRPQDRFFSIVDIHRLSSVFLEPVSLGNWLVIVAIFMIAMWREMSREAVIFFAATSVMILIGCDGRFATVSCLIILAVSAMALKLPRYFPFIYLPAAVAGAVLVVLYLDPSRGDDFLGRLARSVELLQLMDVSSILGVDMDLIRRGADSGISYIILTQSIVGLAVFWCAICFLQPQNTRMSILCLNGVAIYVALNLLISYSMFSLKTAAPLWFLYGYVTARSCLAARERDARTLAHPAVVQPLPALPRVR